MLRNYLTVAYRNLVCIQSYENVEDALNSWNYINNISTYVLLHDQVRSEDIEKLLPRFLNWSWPITGENQELKLQPLANVHFNPDIRAERCIDPIGRNRNSEPASRESGKNESRGGIAI